MRKSEFITGIFVLLAIGALIFAAIRPLNTLLGTAGRERFVAYFNDVSLLENKAKVAVYGKEVGFVDKIESAVDPVSGTARIRVTLLVEESVAKSLRMGTTASIAQEGFLGGKFVKVEPSSATDGELPVDSATDHMRIDTVLYSDMFTKLEELRSVVDPVLKKTESLLTKLETGLLSDDNLRSISLLLSNTNDLVENLDKTLTLTSTNLNGVDGQPGLFTRAGTVLGEMQAALTQFRTDFGEVKEKGIATLTSVDGLLDNTNGAVTEVRALMIERITPALEDVTQKTSALLANLDARTETSFKYLDSVLVHADDFVTNPDLYGAMFEMRQALREVKLLVVSLRADPSQVLFGGEGEAEAADSKMTNETRLRRSGRAKRYGY